MSFIELVKSRQSVRKYSDKTVEKEKIEMCIEAARLAPSACNSQPWTFIVVNDRELSLEIAKATYSPVISFNKFAKQAPVMIVIVIEKPKTITQIGEAVKNREFPLIDIGIAGEHFCLQAHDLGLGTCMIGWFNEKKVKELLNIPEKKRVGFCISLGYQVDNYKFRKKIRKQTDQMCKFNSYQ
ncbi:MAG: nitroreductase family protein [Bacteroidota bacterium]